MKSVRAPRLLYLINSLEVGGAEVGLANLIRRGVFEQMQLDLVTVWAPNPNFISNYPEVKAHFRGALLPHGHRRASDIIAGVVAFRRLIGRRCPDIVIGSLPQAVIIARLTRMLGGRFRMVTFEHSVRLRSSFGTMLFRVTAQWNDAVVADSAATLEAVFSAHGYAADTATCLLSLQDLHACFEKPLLKFDTGRLSMVFVGRLAVEKNLENCLFAMDFARSQGVSLNLDVYGAGDEQFRLEAIARLRGLRDAVAFHGVRFDWLDRVSRSGAFGLLASEREGLSITALQFLALGYPLLTAAAGEIKSYVQDGVNGIIAQDTTARAIATAMVRAWDLRENWPEMAAAARRSAKQFERWSETEQRDRSFRELIRHLARDD